uniref:Disease resistance protein RGA3 n=1 Tax=Nicotiana tabacum TaxID=4097 RepID=A0A1S3YB78_TOBAC|nr:putative disease resistance protein RGA3 [Nicotiana tomentosiformis]XP_016449364.1 PREDICTED: putative disease resistance protein RGA3 [Nicotiana tabacum]
MDLLQAQFQDSLGGKRFLIVLDDVWNEDQEEWDKLQSEEGVEHPNLLEIGKQIIKKCGGVPLAAKTLGTLLSFKREESDWLFVQESELWGLKECDNGILPALRLSYLHFPLYLKQCFAFCSLYPKNYEIQKEKIIHTWISEGLITCHERNRQLEDIGQ